MSSLPAKIQGPRWLAVEPLNVAPQLVGLPLATPARRALAMLVDLALIALLSDVGGFWLVIGLALVALLLRGRGFTTRKRVVVGWVFAAVLALLAIQEAWDDHGPNRATRRAEAVAEAASEAAEAASSPASAPGLGDAEHIAQLEAQIAELRKPQPFEWRKQFDRVIESVGISFGWGIVYFSLLPAWWGGQTLGKKLLKLRIVELTGRPLSVMRCLRRYGGYAAGMATGGLGFLQSLWDPNRQGIQDRVAHTVVVDLRAAPLATEPPIEE